MNDPEKPLSLEDLEARLRKAKGEQAPAGRERGPASATALGIAWRLAIEMVSALAVGGFVGWWLDRWLGTRPWLLLGFLFLGAGSGLVAAVRAAREINRQVESADDGGGGVPPGR
jgi:ATP synthase protein I